jgi:hypothetical protein
MMRFYNDSTSHKVCFEYQSSLPCFQKPVIGPVMNKVYAILKSVKFVPKKHFSFIVSLHMQA